MQAARFSKIISTIAIASLLLCGFFVSNSMSCATGMNAAGVLVGGACTAEATSAPLLWSWSESHIAVQTKTFALLTIIALFVALALPRPQRRDGVLSRWVRLVHPTLTRSGPIKIHTFVPYLFATHGL